MFATLIIFNVKINKLSTSLMLGSFTNGVFHYEKKSYRRRS